MPNLADTTGTGNHTQVVVGTQYPPLRAVWNQGAAGTFTFKGPHDNAAVPMYIDQYEKITFVQIAEIVSLGGTTLYGGW